jgi:membrane protein
LREWSRRGFPEEDGLKIPGMKLVGKAEEIGNVVGVPMTRGLGLADLLKRTFKEAWKDHLDVFAGNLTYKGLFALFPFSVFLLSLLGLFGAQEFLDTLFGRASAVLPEGAAAFLEDQLLGIAASKARGAYTAGAIASLLLTLWGVSGAFRSVMKAMNVIYEIEEARPLWVRYLLSVLLSLGTAALLLFALVLILFGPQLGGAVADAMGLGSIIFRIVWNVVLWPILFCEVLLAFSLVYYFAPDVEQRFRWVSLGSIIAVTLWLVFSVLFSLYVGNFGSFNATYGSLAGVVIFLFYIYWSALIMLIGAEMNQVIEGHIPEGKNEGEKTIDADQ